MKLKSVDPATPDDGETLNDAATGCVACGTMTVAMFEAADSPAELKAVT